MKKRKHLLSFFICFLCSMCISNSVGAFTSVTVVVNETQLGTSGIIIDDRTLVPLRDFAEAMNATVDWDGDTQQVRIQRPITLMFDENIVGTELCRISLKIGDNAIICSDGGTYFMDVPAQLINDKTMIPLRAASESLWSKVDWVAESQTAYVYSINYKFLTYSEYQVLVKQAEQDAIDEITNPTVDVSEVYNWISEDELMWSANGGLTFSIKSVWNKETGFRRSDSLSGMVREVIYPVPDFPLDFLERDGEGIFSGIHMRSIVGKLWFYRPDLVKIGLLSE